MFFGLPTCPCNKKCVPYIEKMRKPIKKIVAVYPKAPEINGRMSDETKILIDNHDKVCKWYFIENLDYKQIAEKLDIPSRFARIYMDNYIVGRIRYE